MRPFKKRICCIILAFQILAYNHPFISYASDLKNEENQKSNSASEGSIPQNIKRPKVKMTDGIQAEYKFYQGDYDEAAYIFESLQKKKDRNYAFFNNQLGSIYLMKGDYKKALDAFLKAHYLMNDVSAFRELESGAISLFGSEASKAYKGDPYEKLFNSLYVGLLLCDEGDFDNAFAAFKNGIVCDSDVEEEQYKSDAYILYLLASRISLMQGNQSMSDDYFNKAIEAYNSVFASKYTLANDAPLAKAFVDLKNNSLLCIELGKGPLKYQIGQYGEMAVFTIKPSEIKNIKVFVDNEEVNYDLFQLSNDAFFQASTRGGRQMDGILKGKAQFKEESAQTAAALAQSSQEMINRANQMRATNPYYNASGDIAAAGLVACFSLIAACFSAASNPVADVRHWSLLPGNIIILPCLISSGKHILKIECFDENKNLLNTLSSEINVKENGDTVIFRRLL